MVVQYGSGCITVPLNDILNIAIPITNISLGTLKSFNSKSGIAIKIISNTIATQVHNKKFS